MKEKDKLKDDEFWNKLQKKFAYTHTRGKNWRWTLYNNKEIVEWFRNQIENKTIRKKKY